MHWGAPGETGLRGPTLCGELPVAETMGLCVIASGPDVGVMSMTAASPVGPATKISVG